MPGWPSGLAKRHSLGRLALVAVACQALAACTVSTTDGPKTSRLVVGVVKVEVPERQGELTAVSVKSLGLGWTKGPFLGWNSSSWVLADPASCQLLVVVRKTVEADSTARILQALKGENVCYVKDL